jgi:hypothetical protein
MSRLDLHIGKGWIFNRPLKNGSDKVSVLIINCQNIDLCLWISPVYTEDP